MPILSQPKTDSDGFVLCDLCSEPSIGHKGKANFCIVHCKKAIEEDIVEKARSEDPSVWGVEAHGAMLFVNESVSLTDNILIIDVENNPDGTCAGMGFTWDGKQIYFFDASTVSQWAKDIFKGCKLVGHNVKYDVQMLRKWGFDVSPDQIIWDTQIAEYVKDSTKRRYGLKDMVKERFGISYPTFKELTGTGKKAVPIGTLPLTLVGNYNGMDVLSTAKLYQDQLDNMTDEQKTYCEQMELPTMRVILEMEERGVQIDANYIRGLDAGFSDGISRVASSLRNMAQSEINLNSHQQIKQFLMDKAGLRLSSTAAEELKKHEQIPVVKDVLRYRELNKLKSTYTSVLLEEANGQETYRLHARFNQTITQTGRLSSSDPNLQNIPTRTDEGDAIRKGFVARGGHVLIDADYSQIEPRIMAHISQDPKLMAVFIEGHDLYDFVASLVGCDRKTAKVLWLAMAYNAGAYKIAITAHISIVQSECFLTKMKLAFGQFFYWRSKTIRQAEIDGGVRTLFGRWIPLPLDFAHLAPNYMIQGSAAEVMKLAIQETRRFDPVCSVHDEMIFEVSEDQLEDADPVDNHIKRVMENVVSLSVPLVAEVGSANNWAEAKQ